MELFVNDLSAHQQFDDTQSFLAAFEQLMAMRRVAGKFNLKIYRHQSFLQTMITSDIDIQQAINDLSMNKMREARSWLMNQAGPFWDDQRPHRLDGRLEYNGENVTNSAVGEAAYRYFQDHVRRDLLSFPSHKWNLPLVRVVWRQDEDQNSDIQQVDIKNWWNHNELENELQQYSFSDIQSWFDLQNKLPAQCDHLIFLDGCFDHLKRVPFEKGLLDRLLEYFEVLNRFAGSFSTDGERTSEGDRLYRDHFTGEEAWFSDSSEGEKRRFKRKMTFRHPERNEDIFCPWHGKPRKRSDPIRFHFSWPIRANEPVYIVYIGPKLTKR